VKSTDISLICTELDRIRGEKLIFKKFGPFSALSVQNRPKLDGSFFHSVLFEFCGRTIGQLATLNSAAAGFTSGTSIQCSGITIRTVQYTWKQKEIFLAVHLSLDSYVDSYLNHFHFLCLCLFLCKMCETIPKINNYMYYCFWGRGCQHFEPTKILRRS
jgi:hypothetical protein